MTLNDMELYEADIQFAVQQRDKAKKLWEYWRTELILIISKAYYDKMKTSGG